ncbi:hypothetical protein [uncultured Lutibacter sp.]|uniref:hypothetical protein n=1 Tax=uncultured Lutibacter sp. TaxID=437739 RepID=UPI00261DF2E0|nr:hypothetical protein [uncultured Lutibacter sp.]
MKTITKKIGQTFSKTMLFLAVISTVVSCETDETVEQFEELNSKLKETSFNFDQFGITHNNYLVYVYNIKDNQNHEARFKHGLSFYDETFGSFDIGLKFEDIKNSIDFHKKRVENILNGNYRAKSENLSPEMTIFLNELAQISRVSLKNEVTISEFDKAIEKLEISVRKNHNIQINLETGISNDGASMLAICSILKYSTKYWSSFGSGNNGGGDTTPLAKGKIKRALADAWGYVSAWVDNGDGSYSWDHQSALVNADCVSDSVRSN